jgi:DNA-binding MarR family transcriptional regulator
MGKLADEIKQTKPFSSVAHEAVLNIQRTAAVFEQAFEEVLKPHGISGTQYNALRILRGAGPQGLPCQEVGARMIRLEPDLTRLFDRLEARAFLARARSTDDRRVVLVRIAPAGTRLLASLDGVHDETLKRLLGRMGERKLRLLITLLEEAREF